MAHYFKMGSAVKWVFCALLDTISMVKLFYSFEYRKIPPNNVSVLYYTFQVLIKKKFCIDFWASKQVPLISTSSQRQRKAVKRICSASLDKQWLEEFVLQITVLNDREFLIATQKSNSIQELETPCLPWHRESKSDLLTEMFDFLLIHMDTNENKFWFGLWFSAWFRPLQNMFCWYTTIFTGAEHSSRIKNKV